MGCFRCSAIFAVTMRVMPSIWPPAAKPTIARSGLAGYVCACAAPIASNSIAANAFVFMVRLHTWLAAPPGAVFESPRLHAGVEYELRRGTPGARARDLQEDGLGRERGRQRDRHGAVEDDHRRHVR